MKLRILKVIILLSSVKALATVPVDPLVALCHPYPEIKSKDPFPSSFNSTNNLARSPESAFYIPEGDKIVIYGRLMGKDCVPINDGKIFIWQANSRGYIQYKTEHEKHLKWFDPNFDGTGITNSDNLGRFNLITILPGSHDKNTPHINIKIEHPDLDDFTTKVYFPQNGHKVYDSSHGKLDSSQVSAVPGKINANGQVTEYFIDITLNQSVPHKEF